ncbi:MAG: hypothetical protein ACYS4W_04575 [Planctomycetota bacterium]|jgi:hypothetical protein
MKSVAKAVNSIIVPLLLVASCAFVALAEETSEFEEINPCYYETDVNMIIEIASAADIAAKRQTLIQYIWGGRGFPAEKVPAEVKENVKDERYAELFNANLRRIDKITIELDCKLESVVYHFIPKESEDKLMIYHQGHRGDFVLGIDAIRVFLEKGYSVMGISMPLLGMNNQPVVNLQRFGKFHVTRHEHLKLLKNPISFFVEPVAVAVNYAGKFGYDEVNMIGISGGGWTTTLCAAIDARIKHSYPVAGTLPIYLRSDSGRDWGDYEQTLPELYTIANYPELYIMGSFGPGRKQVQILNKYDSCCFAGIKYRTYEKVVKEVVRSLGKGKFETFLDETHKEHKISEEVLKAVFKHEGL